MAEVRVENEIKLFSAGGSFAYDGDDAGDSMERLVSVISKEGFSCGMPQYSKHTDYYYTDTKGVFDSLGIVLRYRESGTKAILTMKLPTVSTGMGVSRREIEGEYFNDTRFDKWKLVQEYSSQMYGPAEICRAPALIIESIRGRCNVISEIREYSFTFDKMVFCDPTREIRSEPCYELELESLDKAIVGDPGIVRLVDRFTDRYLFDEEKVSKFDRGMAFLKATTSF